MQKNKILSIVLRVIGLLILVSAAILFVNGSSHNEEPSLDYMTEYIHSVLDAQYKSTDNQNWKTQLWNSDGNFLAEYLGVYNLSEENQQKFASFYESLYKKADYEIGEVKREDKEEEEYVITITVHPLPVMPKINKAATDYLLEFNERNKNGEFAALSELEYDEEYIEGLMKVLAVVFDQVEYVGTESIDIHIRSNSEGIMEIDKEDLNHIYLTMFPR